MLILPSSHTASEFLDLWGGAPGVASDGNKFREALN